MSTVGVRKALQARGLDAVHGVDFSGARLAGRATWVARLELGGRRRSDPPMRLVSLDPLERLAGTAEREPALAHLVGEVRASTGALWGFDFPFGLPMELVPARSGWRTQYDLVREQAPDDYGLGLECLRRARALGGAQHLRRQTDAEAKAPFDPYHYRIIYQTFYGMHHVVERLYRQPGTAVLPFQYARLPGASRVLVETCPASTLKRLRLPHQNFKQASGGPLSALRRRTRHAILAGLADLVAIDDAHRRVVMRNPGGDALDALDAIVAAVGSADALARLDHGAIAAHARYPREGHLYY